MKNGVQVDAIYTDFSKAFDKVSHRLLLSKLAKLEFSGSFLAWIGSYLTGREQYVKASGSQSRRFPVFLLLATVTLQMRRLHLMFLPLVHRQRDAVQLGEVQEHEFHKTFSI
jgi:hypothetical protein